jgi:hypothetical protein
VSRFAHLNSRRRHCWPPEREIAAGHKLTVAQFTAGSSAVGIQAQFVWDVATGHLYWDADGIGTGAAIDLAGFDGTPGLTKDDLFFV